MVAAAAVGAARAGVVERARRARAGDPASRRRARRGRRGGIFRVSWEVVAVKVCRFGFRDAMLGERKKVG